MSETQNSSGAIVPFHYADAQVRVVVIGGEPWFVLADLCKVLGLARGASQVSDRLDEGVRQTYPLRTAGGMQNATVVSEAGMYEVVIRSDKPEAVAFRRWITAEVLPEIRRTGSYGTPRIDVSSITRLQIAQMLVESETALAESLDRNAELVEQHEADRPAVEYVTTHVLVDDDVMLIEDWGRAYGLTRPQAFELLLAKDLVWKKAHEHWSGSKKRKVTEYEYRNRAGKPSFDWFALKEQRDAPRRHNGQARTTLYVKAMHAVDLARLTGLLPNIEVVA